MELRKRIQLRMNESEFRQEDIRAYTYDDTIGESIIGWDDLGNPYISISGGYLKPIRGFLEWNGQLAGITVMGHDGVRWIYIGNGGWERE